MVGLPPCPSPHGERRRGREQGVRDEGSGPDGRPPAILRRPRQLCRRACSRTPDASIFRPPGPSRRRALQRPRLPGHRRRAAPVDRRPMTDMLAGGGVAGGAPSGAGLPGSARRSRHRPPLPAGPPGAGGAHQGLQPPEPVGSPRPLGSHVKPGALRGGAWQWWPRPRISPLSPPSRSGRGCQDARQGSAWEPPPGRLCQARDGSWITLTRLVPTLGFEPRTY